jgi:hypothetical protein
VKDSKGKELRPGELLTNGKDKIQYYGTDFKTKKGRFTYPFALKAPFHLSQDEMDASNWIIEYEK